VQQQKSGCVFRAGLSVRNGETINLHRAIKGGVLHETIPFLGIGQQLKGREQHRNRQRNGWDLQASDPMERLKWRIIRHLSGSRLPFEIVKHTQQMAYFSCLLSACGGNSLRPEGLSYRPSILKCSLFSHRQNDAELCFAAHHARVGFSRFVERIGFNHGTHAG
jgi:hypothetical protein